MREEGFSFVEVIAATFVAALSLVTLFSAFSSNLGRMAQTEELRLLTSVAEAQMERVGLDIELAEGAREGIEAGVGWIVEIEPVPGDHGGNAEKQFEPLKVRVKTWVGKRADGARTFELETVKISPKSEALR